MKTWKYHMQKSGDTLRDVPLRPDKVCDRDRCDKCGSVPASGLHPHKGLHICINCKINLVLK
jgi:hypothetical protein